MKIDSLSEARNKEEFLQRFGKIPKSLYPERPLPPDGYWAYLISQFPEVDAEFFILSENGTDVGRIGCNISQGHQDVGFFGFFELDLDFLSHGSEMIKKAHSWLEEKDVKRIVGPIDLNVWLGNRFKAAGEKNFSWEPNGPKEYISLFEENGFRPSKGYISMIYDDNIVSHERTKSAYEAALAEGYSFRNLDLSREKEIEKLYELNLKSFKVNYMYEPISREQYENLHVRAVKALDLQYSFFILSPEGEEVGYVFSFVEDGILIVKSILMDPEKQGARLASALLHASLNQARKNGAYPTVGAMVRKGNVSEHFFDHLQKPISKNEYLMMEKTIQ